MRMSKKFLTLVAPLLLMVGCSTSVTNLTPHQQLRTPTGLYPFEAKWESKQQSVVKDSIKPIVVIGTDTYPMQPVPMVKNRWEAMVPIPADKSLVHYQFKFDYQYLAIPQRRPDSKLSDPYDLKIIDR